MMLHRRETDSQGIMSGMVWLGAVVSAVVVLLRVWLLPAMADWQTGMFTSNYWVIGLMLGTLVALLIMKYFAGSTRREIVGSGAVAVALASMVAGAVLAVFGAIDLMKLYGLIGYGAGASTNSLLSTIEYGFCLLGGLALVRLGLALLTEGATRRGIAQWTILAPVLWAWFRLISYEMSYASMVRIEDNFFGLLMLIAEILFLFRLARFVSGIGRVGAPSLLFHAMATVLFAVSGPLTRAGMYLLQDTMAVEAYHLAGPTDIAVGILALVVGISLLSGEDVAHPMEEEEPVSDVLDKEAEEASASVAADLLLDILDDE